MKASIYRKEYFNAAHRLHNYNWTDKKNKAIFGKCNNPNFHGHNYTLTLQITGEIDSETGYVYDTKLLGDIVKKYVLRKFDHKNLNLDLVEFKNLNPTVENIARVIWNILRNKISNEYNLKIIIYETERNYVEYPHD